MLCHCANARCSRKFQYLHQGKVFLMKSIRDDKDDFSPSINFAGRVDGIQYAWLCDKCASKFEVVLDAEERIKIRSLYPSSGLMAAMGVSIGMELLSVMDVFSGLADLMA